MGSRTSVQNFGSTGLRLAQSLLKPDRSCGRSSSSKVYLEEAATRDAANVPATGHRDNLLLVSRRRVSAVRHAPSFLFLNRFSRFSHRKSYILILILSSSRRKNIFFKSAFFFLAISFRVFAANDLETLPDRGDHRGSWRFAFRKRYLQCRKFTARCSVLFFPAVKLGGIHDNDSE